MTGMQLICEQHVLHCWHASRLRPHEFPGANQSGDPVLSKLASYSDLIASLTLLYQ